MKAEQIEEFWNTEKARLHASEMPEVYEKFSKRIIHALGKLAPGSKILDLGCGDGTLTHLVRQNFPDCKFYGCDLSKHFIETAKKKHPDIDFRVENLLSGSSYDDSFFDVIFSHGVIQYIPASQLDLFFINTAKITAPTGFSAHLDFCDKDKFFGWFPKLTINPRSWARFFLKGAFQSYLTNKLWEDGTFWHRRAQFIEACSQSWSKIEFWDSDAAYRTHFKVSGVVKK